MSEDLEEDIAHDDSEDSSDDESNDGDRETFPNHDDEEAASVGPEIMSDDLEEVMFENPPAVPQPRFGGLVDYESSEDEQMDIDDFDVPGIPTPQFNRTPLSPDLLRRRAPPIPREAQDNVHGEEAPFGSAPFTPIRAPPRTRPSAPPPVPRRAPPKPTHPPLVPPRTTPPVQPRAPPPTRQARKPKKVRSPKSSEDEHMDIDDFHVLGIREAQDSVHGEEALNGSAPFTPLRAPPRTRPSVPPLVPRRVLPKPTHLPPYLRVHLLPYLRVHLSRTSACTSSRTSACTSPVPPRAPPPMEKIAGKRPLLEPLRIATCRTKKARTPKNSRVRTIRVDNSKTQKRLNVGLPKTVSDIEMKELRSAVRALLRSFEESEASQVIVQRFSQHRLPQQGPSARQLEHDLEGNMGSPWNKRVVELALALQTHMKYRRDEFKKRLLAEPNVDPQVAEMRRLETNQYNRRQKRHVSRLDALWFFKEGDATVDDNLTFMSSMDATVHSDDEEQPDGTFIALRPVWRSRETVVEEFFRIPDILFFSRHFRTIDCRHRMPGQLPGIRTHTAVTNDNGRWLRRFKEEEPLLYATLNVQPAIDLRSIQFSPIVRRMVERVRHSKIGVKRKIGK
ncbi:hypothetical protein BDZ89DRAFT_1147444 [Hymenopellis radicata]|nr:hypothetical protein BDZ89DRAFT_1147444 [Hymenopellis radicata]